MAEPLAFLEQHGMTYVTVDAPPDVIPLVVGRTSGTAYVRFHGRNAGTWNSRGGSAAQRFDHLYDEAELREWVPPLRRLSEQAAEAYAFFNNNNQTHGVAQAPAGALLLRKLLEDKNIPTA